MPYKYRVWCPHCLDEDFQGCFGGGWELSDETFQTVEDAIKAADEYVTFLPTIVPRNLNYNLRASPQP
jgi:hypothetical protein